MMPFGPSNFEHSPRALPFDAFLDLLRAKEFGVGLNEYSALAHLLARWEGVAIAELADAIGALIGRNQDEAERIRALFLATYAPPPPPIPPPPPVPEKSAWIRSHAWLLAVAGAVLLIVLAVILRPAPSGPPPQPSSVVPQVVTPTSVEAVQLPPPPPPELPAAPTRLVRPVLVAFVVGSFLSALAGFWLLKIREGQRTWLRSAWASVRATLPGPFHFDERVRTPTLRLAKADVEDAATLLGRVFSRTGQTRELDIRHTLQATLRRGSMPTLVTRPRRVSERMFVLRDVCQEMRMWESKVDALLTDLRRQGISLKVYYFDGDISRLSERPHAPAASIDAIVRPHPDSPLLVISSGSGLPALIQSPDQQWSKLLARRPRSSWLTPVTDLRVWPPAFEALPLDVWPMTRTGLAAAARQLAGIDAERSPLMREQLVREGRVTREDIERLKRLASLVPHPSPRLLDALRREFAADVPDAAILHLMNEGGGPSVPLIELPVEELQFNANMMRRESPDLEAAARTSILGVLMDSEPVLKGSAAHERWQIAAESQRLQLADLRGSATDAAAALDALRGLSEGPMGVEVAEAMRLVPTTTTMRERAQAIERPQQEVSSLTKEGRARLRSVVPERWTWPGLRELVPASSLAAALTVLALGLNVLPARALGHLMDAYGLDYVAQSMELRLSLRSTDPRVPREVRLYREDGANRGGLTVGGPNPTTLRLREESGADWNANVPGVVLTSVRDGRSHHYQVRGRLADGTLALSPWLWVASEDTRFVLIDAMPWANVTITGSQTRTGTQVTPFTAALQPGTYRVHFENPTLGAQAVVDQTLTVPAPNQTLRVTMPGFNAEQTADSLLQTQAAAR
jgi:hypothetical protein